VGSDFFELSLIVAPGTIRFSKISTNPAGGKGKHHVLFKVKEDWWARHNS